MIPEELVDWGSLQLSFQICFWRALVLNPVLIISLRL